MTVRVGDSVRNPWGVGWARVVDISGPVCKLEGTIRIKRQTRRKSGWFRLLDVETRWDYFAARRARKRKPLASDAGAGIICSLTNDRPGGSLAVQRKQIMANDTDQQAPPDAAPDQTPADAPPAEAPATDAPATEAPAAE